MNIIARVARSGVFIFILIFRVIVRRKGELVLVFHSLCSPPRELAYFIRTNFAANSVARDTFRTFSINAV